MADWEQSRWRMHEAKVKLNPKYVNPMQMKPEDVATSRDLTIADLEFLQALPIAIVVDGYCVVHGGLLPGKTLEQHLASKKLWSQALRLRWVRNGRNVPVDYDNLKPGPPEGSKHWTDLYDGDLQYLDRQVGRLLDFLEKRGRLDDVLLLVTSDHGEHLLEVEGYEAVATFDVSDQVAEVEWLPGRGYLEFDQTYRVLKRLP